MAVVSGDPSTPPNGVCFFRASFLESGVSSLQSHLQQQSHKSSFKRHEPSSVSHKGKVILWTLESFVTKGFVQEDFQRQKGSWMLNSFQNSTGAECLLPTYTFENHPMYYLFVFPGIFFLSPWYIRNVSVMQVSHSSLFKAFYMVYVFVLLEQGEKSII